MDRASALPTPAKRVMVPLDWRTNYSRLNAQMCRTCYRALNDPYWHEQTHTGIVCTQWYHCTKCDRRLDYPEYHRKSATGIVICLKEVWECSAGIAWKLKGLPAHIERQDMEMAAIIPLIMRVRGDTAVQNITFTARKDETRGAPLICWETRTGQKGYWFTLWNHEGIFFLVGYTFVKDRPGPYANEVLCQYITKVPLVLRPVIYLLKKIVPDMIDTAGITVPALDSDSYYYESIYEKISALAMHACAMMMPGTIPTHELTIGELKLHIREVDPIVSNSLRDNPDLSNLLVYLHDIYQADQC